MSLEIELMLDSGAFSAWSLGRPVDLDKYIEFCVKNKQFIKHIINLDHINPENPEEAAAIGRANFLKMKNAGLDPIPVFHAKESMSWMELMCQDSPYVGISGTSIVSPVEVKQFYDYCFHYITDSKGQAIVDTHSFGDTSPDTLYNYPFTSADSSTWMIQAGRAARVKLQGKSYQLRSTKMRDSSYISLDDVGPKKQAWMTEISELGLDPTILMTVDVTPSQMAMLRSYLVASDLLRLKDRTAHVTTFKRPKSLLCKKRTQDGGKPRSGPCNIHLVISPSAYYFNFVLINALQVKHVLVSYFYVENAPKKFLDERLLPFLADPDGFCRSDPKVAKYYDKLNEVILKTNVNLNVPAIAKESDLQADPAVADTQI